MENLPVSAFLKVEGARQDYRPREDGLTISNLITIKNMALNFMEKIGKPKGKQQNSDWEKLQLVVDNCTLQLELNQEDPEELTQEDIDFMNAAAGPLPDQTTPPTVLGEKNPPKEAPQAPNFLDLLAQKVNKIEWFLTGNRLQQQKFQANTGFSYRTICQLQQNGIETLTIGEAVRLLNFDVEKPDQLKIF